MRKLGVFKALQTDNSKPIGEDRHEPSRETRTSGKRADPDYKQALAYVRRDTHRRVMMRLAGEDREFSDLVETLLSEWLNS
jgi:hypothetical protein